MSEEQKETTESEGSAFNSAVATLMRLDRILINIKDLILDKELSSGLKQHKKYNLVKAFYVQSSALIRNADNKLKIKSDISKLKPFFGKYLIGGREKIKPKFSYEFEDSLDNLLVLIQETLQEDGYFMPEKSDRGL